MKISDLLADAVSGGHLPEEAASAAMRHLSQPEQDHEMPWYLHALVAVGAWLAAIFFVGFTAAILGAVLFQNKGTGVVGGILLLGGVVLTRRAAKGPFLRQLCLALSVTAHALILIGIYGVDRFAWRHGLPPVATVILSAALYELYPETLHRFLTCAGALVLTTLWLEDQQAPYFSLWLSTVVLSSHLATLGWIFARHTTPTRFRALGYAVAVSLLVLVLPHLETWQLKLRFATAAWPTRIVLTASLLVLLRWIAGPPRSGPAWLLGAPAPILLGVTTTPGVLAGLFLLVLGFALQERVLASLGLVSLPVFLAFHYYQLDLTFLQKSIALVVGGLTLLILRGVLQRRHAPTLTLV